MSVIVDYTADFDRDEWSAWLSEYGIDLHTTHHVELDLARGAEHVVVTAYVYKTNLEGKKVKDAYGDFAMDSQSFVSGRVPDYEVRPLSQ